MNAEFFNEIVRIAKDINVDKSIILDSFSEALKSALQKKYGIEEENIEIDINEDEGYIDIGVYKTIVEKISDEKTEILLEEAVKMFSDDEMELGEEIFVPFKIQDFSRIAIQTIRQVLTQRIRDAEKDAIMSEFSHKVGDLVTGYVRRVEKRRKGRGRGTVIVNLGKVDAEGILPEQEQIPREVPQPGEKIKVLLKDIRSDIRAGSPQLILSRTDNKFLKELFKLEVPEIYDDVVEVKAVAREPGVRAKIAVATKDADVDPIGACVGVKGSRIQNIVQELSGEKIDVVLWSDDPAQLVENALSPAEIVQVILDEEAKKIEVVVLDDQLSLAIGSKGRNVKLASMLTGWSIDISSETDYMKMSKEAKKALGQITGITDIDIEVLFHSGFKSIENISKTNPDELSSVTGISLENSEKYIEEAIKMLSEQAAE